MDTWFVVLLIGAGIVSAAGPIVWASAILCSNAGASRGVDALIGAGATQAPPEELIHHLDAALARLERLVHSTCRHPHGPGTMSGKSRPISAFKQLRMQNMFMEAQAGIRHLDGESRRRYQARVADLSELAASAGIYCSPEPG